MMSSMHAELSQIINYLDEITIVLFVLVTLKSYIKGGNIKNKVYFYLLLLPIALFCLSGIVSGIMNGNGYLVTGIGIFDYVKNFLVIFIYGFFFRNKDDYKVVFRGVLIVAVIISIVAVIHEIWAIIARYVLSMEFEEMKGWLFGKDRVTSSSWRYGLFRARSLMHNSIIMGQYCLIILSFYLYTSRYLNFRKRIRSAVITVMLSAILSSVSRMAHLGLTMLLGLFAFNSRVWSKVVIFFTILLVSLTSSAGILNTEVMMKDADISSETIVVGCTNDEVASFREYTRRKGMEILKDHPLLGVGPGMFGGNVSILFNSPIYEEYHLAVVRNYMTKWGGIDQYWPHLLAEVGIIGTGFFLVLIITLFLVILFIDTGSTPQVMKGLSSSLSTSLVLIIIFLMGSGLNITSVIYTFSAFVGIRLGYDSETA
jgi:hypothetical protein